GHLAFLPAHSALALLLLPQPEQRKDTDAGADAVSGRAWPSVATVAACLLVLRRLRTASHTTPNVRLIARKATSTITRAAPLPATCSAAGMSGKAPARMRRSLRRASSAALGPPVNPPMRTSTSSVPNGWFPRKRNSSLDPSAAYW